MTEKSTVLFVDDDQALLNGIRRVLHQEPYAIITASDGTQALEILQAQQVDVIVSDEKMPHMDGTEFLAIAAQKYPQTVRIMLTGQADLETAVKAINQGEIYRFLTKPCSEIELGVCIRQALQHQELLGQAHQMLGTLRIQSSYIKHLEKAHPGISQVEKDQTGRVILEGGPYDLETLLKKIEEELNGGSK